MKKQRRKIKRSLQTLNQINYQLSLLNKMKNPNSGKAVVNDINIYYEIHGEGKPLLLIEGLGYSSWMWFKQIPAFSREYKVIVFDNRGVGNTDKPDIEYTIEMMADDAAGLLKVLGEDQVH